MAQVEWYIISIGGILQSKIVSRCFIFFNDTATPEIYTLSLHDALPICRHRRAPSPRGAPRDLRPDRSVRAPAGAERSEEHTSELQSQSNLVCRLLLETKKTSYLTNVPGLSISSAAILQSNIVSQGFNTP